MDVASAVSVGCVALLAVVPHNQHLQLKQHPLQQYCMYILYLKREKELASTSFGHMRAFSSLTISGALSAVRLQVRDVRG